MFWLGFLSLPVAVQGQFSTTMLRFGCSQIAIDRIDPYVNHRQPANEAERTDSVPVLLSPAAFRPRTSIRSSEGYGCLTSPGRI